MSTFILQNVVLVGCDRRISEAEYCPRLLVIHGAITAGRVDKDATAKQVARHGWVTVKPDGLVFERAYCPAHLPGMGTR